MPGVVAHDDEFNAAMKAIGVYDQANPSIESISQALLQEDVHSLGLFRACSCMRTGAMRHLAQALLHAAVEGDGEQVQARALFAVLRILLVISHPSDVQMACEEFSKVPETCWTVREKAILAMLAGVQARSATSWSEVFEKSAQYASSPGSTDRNLVDSSVAARFVLGTAAFGLQLDTPIKATSWQEESRLHPEPSAATIFVELSWAELARRMSRSLEICGPPIPMSSSGSMGDCNSAKAAGTSAGLDTLYATVENVRLRRRRSPRRATSMHAPDQPTLSQTPASLGACEDPNVTSALGDLEFMLTESVKTTLQKTAAAMADGRSTVLEGPAGCGKTSTIAYIGQLTAPYGVSHAFDDSFVRIQMDTTASLGEDDFAALLGAIVPLPNGGGFVWRPGLMGRAISRGALLVLENVDRIPARSYAASVVEELAQLRPGDTFPTPSGGEMLVAGPGFAVIATRTSTPTTKYGVDLVWEPPGTWARWSRVEMPDMDEGTKLELLRSRFPTVSDCIPRVIASMEALACGPYGVDDSYQQRRPSMRDAYKICARLTSLRSQEQSTLSPELACIECIDVLCQWDSDPARRSGCAAALCEVWSISYGTVSTMLETYVPQRQIDRSGVGFGRAFLSRVRGTAEQGLDSGSSFSYSRHALQNMERICRTLEVGENVLLVGESGTGKTAMLQELAELTGQEVVVVNMSRNSDMADLLGGFRPIHRAARIKKLAARFETAFVRVASRVKNERFLEALRHAARSSSTHARAVKLMHGAARAIPRDRYSADLALQNEWLSIKKDLADLAGRLSGAQSSRSSRPSNKAPIDEPRDDCAPPVAKRAKLDRNTRNTQQGLKTGTDGEAEPTDDTESSRSRASVEFEFVDGPLTDAIRKGKWILLDELNLAPTEVLEGLAGLADERRIPLANADGEVVKAAPQFALLAAMNPPTDFGKKPLPPELRSRFTELIISDAEAMDDVTVLCFDKLKSVGRSLVTESARRKLAADVARFYLECRSLAESGDLAHSHGKKARFSCRTLTRMLEFGCSVAEYLSASEAGTRRALLEGALLSFATSLDRKSRDTVRCLAHAKVLGSEYNARKPLESLASMIRLPRGEVFAKLNGYFIALQGTESSAIDVNVDAKVLDVDSNAHSSSGGYVLTKTVRGTLEDICRGLMIGCKPFPILLEGPTAAGKTSMVRYLAGLLGRPLVRINNHEHTDVAEYLGGYVALPDGSLVFQEGPVVLAARRGDWLVLDELNLAPPEVLEALNRLLDDNREIRIPETGEIVRADPKFRVFATQNPPGLYGGRKELSVAFRSRFLEIQVDELDDHDLKEILVARFTIPVSFAERMIAVMRDLQTRRKTSQMFAGKGGYVTARDIFRWANRAPASQQELAVQGFLLLGDRVRVPEERETIRQVLQDHIKVEAAVLSDESLYSFDSVRPAAKPHQVGDDSSAPHGCSSLLSALKQVAEECGVALTPAARRMLILIARAALSQEPVLLVGETGCGKTTMCEVVSRALARSLTSVSCHRHTEASDFVGAYRPGSGRKSDTPPRRKRAFEWVDGPLVKAMRGGHCLLLDEINMAADAVAERLNSALENEKTLALTEKGTSPSEAAQNHKCGLASVELVTAAKGFQVFATMNPGGDFGKRELSPALRDRFTEIWVPESSSIEDFRPVVERVFSAHHNSMEAGSAVSKDFLLAADAILAVVDFCLHQGKEATSPPFRNAGAHEGSLFCTGKVTLRDASAWATFVGRACCKHLMDPMAAFAHGARLVLLDGLEVGSTSANLQAWGNSVWREVLRLLPERLRNSTSLAQYSSQVRLTATKNNIFFGPFPITDRQDLDRATTDPAADTTLEKFGFSFSASSTVASCARIARAMTLEARSVLLEGPPGAGKSALVQALSSLVSASFTRINLAENTELSDLLGGFVPTETIGKFEFRNGPLLTAMLEGHWLLLDELNLASQSVLEGLNSLLDHRRAVYVPELEKEVRPAPSFRLFGAQNPATEGGGRKGLPKSFLNRFTRVSVCTPSTDDIVEICRATHPRLEPSSISRVVRTLRRLAEDLPAVGEEYFGLRDALRWCDLLDGVGSGLSAFASRLASIETLRAAHSTFFDLVVLQRLSSEEERRVACTVLEEVFNWPYVPRDATWFGISWDRATVRFGRVILPRGPVLDALPAKQAEVLSSRNVPTLERMAIATSASWPIILSCGHGSVSDTSVAEGMAGLFAGLCGRKLVRVNLSSSSDSSDLLGSFCQSDAIRELLEASAVACTIADRTLAGTIGHDDHRPLASDLSIALLEEQRARMASHACAARQMDRTSVSVKVAEDLATAVFGVLSTCEKAVPRDASDLRTEIAGCCARLERARELVGMSNAGAFEWLTSSLVQSIERGDWVLLPNGNRCNAAVLDRLNPLLERPPVRIESENDRERMQSDRHRILLPEAPSRRDGSPAFLSPHPDFRMFMTVDCRACGGIARSGLSRAIRDRSIEVRMPHCEDAEVKVANLTAAGCGTDLAEAVVRSCASSMSSSSFSRTPASEHAELRVYREAHSSLSYEVQTDPRTLVRLARDAVLPRLAPEHRNADPSQDTELFESDSRNLPVSQRDTALVRRSLRVPRSIPVAAANDVAAFGCGFLTTREFEGMREQLIEIEESSEHDVVNCDMQSSNLSEDVDALETDLTLSTSPKSHIVLKAQLCEDLVRSFLAAARSWEDFRLRAELVCRLDSYDHPPIRSMQVKSFVSTTRRLIEGWLSSVCGSPMPNPHEGLPSQMCEPIDATYGAARATDTIVSETGVETAREGRHNAGLALRFVISRVADIITSAEQLDKAMRRRSGGSPTLLQRSRAMSETEVSEDEPGISLSDVITRCAFPALGAIVAELQDPSQLVEIARESAEDAGTVLSWLNDIHRLWSLATCVRQTDSTAHVRFATGLLHIVNNRPKAFGTGGAIEALDKTFARIASDLRPFELVPRRSIADQAVSCARLSCAQEAEDQMARFCQAPEFQLLGVQEKRLLLEALVTLSSAASSIDASLIKTFEGILTHCREATSVAADRDRDENSGSAVHVCFADSARIIGLTAKVTTSFSGLGETSSRSTDANTRRAAAISRDLLGDAVRLPIPRLADLLPFRRLVWKYEAGLAEDAEPHGQVITRELLLSLHSQLLNRTHLGEPFASSSDCWELGMSVTSNALMELSDEISRQNRHWSAQSDLAQAAIGLAARGTQTEHFLLENGSCVLELLEHSLRFVDPELSMEENCADGAAGSALESSAPGIRRWYALADQALQSLKQACHAPEPRNATTRRISSALHSYGAAWVFVGYLRFASTSELFRGGQSVDPAIVSEAQAWWKLNSARHHLSRAYALQVLSSFRFDASFLTLPDAVKCELEAAAKHDAEFKELAKCICSRPHGRPSYGVLKERCRQLSLSLEASEVPALIRSLEPDSADETSPEDAAISLRRCAELVDSLSSARERLQSGADLSHFRDLTGELQLSLAEIAHGLACCAKAASASFAILPPRQEMMQRRVVADLLTYPQPTVVRGQTIGEFIANYGDLAGAHHLLDILVSVVGSEATPTEQLFDAVSTGFDYYVKQWKYDLEEEAIEAERKSAMFVLKRALDSASARFLDDSAEEANDMEATFGVTEDEGPGDASERTVSADAREDNPKLQIVAPKPAPEPDSAARGQGKRHNKYCPTTAWGLYQSIFSGKHGAEVHWLGIGPVERLAGWYTAIQGLLESAKTIPSIHSLAPGVDLWSPFAAITAICRASGAPVFGRIDGRDGGEHKSTSHPSDCYNFYVDSNPGEIEAGMESIAKLSRRTKHILETHFSDTGGHPVLDQVAGAVGRACGLGVQVPISTAVVAFEAALRRADEWEKRYAGKDMKLGAEIKAVVKICARWRKLELESWPGLLRGRVARAEARGHNWFLYLYDISRSSMDTDMVSTDLKETLDYFLRTSPVCEYALRVSMLRCISRHLSVHGGSISPSEEIPTLLRNLSAFYAQYQDQVDALVADGRRPLEARLKELATLASWKKEESLGSSTTFHALPDRGLEYERLKASSIHTRRKLHSVCKEMDAVLQKPAWGAISSARSAYGYETAESGTSESASAGSVHIERTISRSREIADSLSRAATPPSDMWDICLDAKGKWLSQAEHLYAKLGHVADAIGGDGGHPALLGSATARYGRSVIRERLKALRSNPNVGIQTKQKALSELLKTLKLLGISMNFTPERASSGESSWLLSPSPIYGNDLESELQGSFVRCMSAMSRLEECYGSGQISPDIPRPVASKIISASRHMAYLRAQERHILEEATSLHRELALLSSRLDGLHVPEGGRGYSNSTPVPQDVPLTAPRHHLDSVCRVLAQLRLTADDISHVAHLIRVSLGRADPGGSVGVRSGVGRQGATGSRALSLEVVDLLQRAAEKIKEVTSSSESQVPCVPGSKTPFVTREEASAYRSASEKVHALAKSLQELRAVAEKLPSGNLASMLLASTADLCRESISQSAITESDAKPIGTLEHSGANLEATVERAVEACLIGAQKARNEGRSRLSEGTLEPPCPKASHGEALPPDPQSVYSSLLSRAKGLVAAHSSALACVETLNLRTLQGCLDTVCATLKDAREHANSCQLLSHATGRFVNRYLATFVAPVLGYHLDHHREALRMQETLMHLFVGLLTEGFCRPPESDASGAALEGASTVDGTGLADVGDGDASMARDISEEIEDEEQLLGLQGDSVDNETRAKGEQKDESPEDDPAQGVEVEADFDGELEDYDGPEDTETGSDDAHSREERMADGQDPNAETVDERIWGDNNGSPHDEIGPAENDGEIQGPHAGSSELVAKEDNDVVMDKTVDKEAATAQSHDDGTDQGVEESQEEPEGDETLEDGAGRDDDFGQDDSNSRGSRKIGTEETGANDPTSGDGSDVDGDPKANDSDENGDTKGLVEPDPGPTNGDSDSDSIAAGDPEHNGRADIKDAQRDEGTEERQSERDDSEAEMDVDSATGADAKVGAYEHAADKPDIVSDRDPDENESEHSPRTDRETANEDPSENENEAGDASSDEVKPPKSDAKATRFDDVDNGNDPPPSSSRNAGNNDVVVGLRSATARDSGDHGERTAGDAAGDSQAAAATPEDEAMGAGNSEPPANGEPHAPGESGPKEESGGRNSDPNPFRENAEIETAERWTYRLRALIGQRGDEPEAGHHDTGQDEGQVEYTEESADPGTQDSKFALGNALETQHRALPEGGEVEDPMVPDGDGVNEDRSASAKTSVDRRDSGMVDADAANEQQATPEEQDVPGQPASKADPAETRQNKEPGRGARGSLVSRETMEMGPEDRDGIGSEDDPDDDSRDDDGKPSIHSPERLGSLDETSWRSLVSAAAPSAAALCENLRLVLEPTVASGLAGDFRTGKRLNMRRVIDFVASDFRHDRIWLRRVRPERRSYDVLVAIDDSGSMAESGAGMVALQALALLTSALSLLEVGRVAVASFGEAPQLVRALDDPLPIDNSSGERMVEHFSFAQARTNVSELLKFIRKQLAPGHPGDSSETVQLAFVISDGRLGDRAEVQRQARQLREKNILLAFVIVDVKGSGESIFDVKRVEYDASQPTRVSVTPYMDEFPAEFYAVVQDVSSLPGVLADGLRQWFEAVSSSR